MALHLRLFYLLLVLLPTQLGLHFWPSWSLILGRRIDFLSPTLYLTDILILFIVISYIIETKKYYFSIPLILYSFINILFSSSKEISLYTWAKVFEYVALGYYIIQIKPEISRVVFMLSIGVWFSGILAILQFLLQHAVGGPFWFLGERNFFLDTPGIAKNGFMQLRPYATFPHPNVLGGYIAVLLPLFFNQIKSTYYRVTIGIALIALFLSFSRTAWIVAAIGLILYFIKKHVFFPIIVSIFLLVFAVFFRPTMQDDAVVRRLELNKTAFSMWKTSPIVGVGAGNFITSLPHFSTNRDIFFLQPVHNMYLLLLSEYGFIGLLFLFMLLYRLRDKNTIFLLPVSCLLILGLFDHYPLTLQQGQILTVLVFSMVYSWYELQEII